MEGLRQAPGRGAIQVPKQIGGEKKKKNEKQYEKYTERNYSDSVCCDDGCECFGGSASC